MSDIRIYDVLNLGAGWQSSRVFLGSCRGELPRLDAAVFADTRWEPKAVYHHLEWLKQIATEAGIPLVTSSAGDLRADAIEFRENRKSSDGKRFASIPVFVRNVDGSAGRVRRQCTREYKIDVVDRWIRRELLGLASGRRIPEGVIVRQWFGISDDERERAVFPGRTVKKKSYSVDMFGDKYLSSIQKRWFPAKGREHVYPLLNEIWTADRSVIARDFFDRPQTRADCGEWLRGEYPDRRVPRSACIGCPFHSNEEWKRMHDESPEEFEDACTFDESMRGTGIQDTGRRKGIVGTLFLHRQLVPLREVDFGGIGEPNCGGCGSLFDGQDGLCGV